MGYVDVAEQFIAARFPAAKIAVMGGSSAAGTRTPTSDIDLLLIGEGAPEEDIAHCRVNLAQRQCQAVADDFLNRGLRATGRSDCHPYWDLLDVVSMGGGQPPPRLEEFIAAASRL